MPHYLIQAAYTPEAWAAMQMNDDMAQAMKHADEIKVRRLPTPALGAE